MVAGVKHSAQLRPVEFFEHEPVELKRTVLKRFESGAVGLGADVHMQRQRARVGLLHVLFCRPSGVDVCKRSQ